MGWGGGAGGKCFFYNRISRDTTYLISGVNVEEHQNLITF